MNLFEIGDIIGTCPEVKVKDVTFSLEESNIMGFLDCNSVGYLHGIYLYEVLGLLLVVPFAFMVTKLLAIFNFTFNFGNVAFLF